MICFLYLEKDMMCVYIYKIHCSIYKVIYIFLEHTRQYPVFVGTLRWWEPMVNITQKKSETWLGDTTPNASTLFNNGFTTFPREKNSLILAGCSRSESFPIMLVVNSNPKHINTRPSQTMTSQSIVNLFITLENKKHILNSPSTIAHMVHIW